MSTLPSQSELISIEEYFRREATSEVKHDYIDGRAVAMAGGSAEHSLITANVIGEARSRLKGKPCRTYDSNFLIGIPKSTHTHYPDATIVCGELQRDPRDPSGHTFTNPVVVIEVLSPSTAGYDRGEKFDHYRMLTSFREYVLVFQDRAEVHTFYRDEDGAWAFNVFTGQGSTVRLRSVNIELSMAEIYDGITFSVDVPS